MKKTTVLIHLLVTALSSGACHSRDPATFTSSQGELLAGARIEVRDIETRRMVPGVRVYVRADSSLPATGDEPNAVTDSTGMVTLERLRPGVHHIIVTGLGYVDAHHRLSVGVKELHIVRFALRIANKGLRGTPPPA